MIHGATADALRSGELHAGTLLGRNERRQYLRLVRQYGGPRNISPELDLMCRALARLETLSLIARNQIVNSGSAGDAVSTSGATDALLRAIRELRDLLGHPALHAGQPSFAAGRDVSTMTDEELEFLARGVPIPPPGRPIPPRPDRRVRSVLLLPPPRGLNADENEPS